MKTYEIGLPFTPSVMRSHNTYPAKKLTVTWGGGLGGSSWEVITGDVFDLNERFIEIRDVSGERYKINTNYIVRISNITIAETSIENTGNRYVDKIVGIGETKKYKYECEEGSVIKFVPATFTNDPAKKIGIF